MKITTGNEYRTTIALMAGATLLACAIILLRLVPLRNARTELQERMEALEQEMAPFLSRNALDPLEEQAKRQESNTLGLHEERERLMILRDTFHGASPFEKVLPSPEEGRIDFKVALFHARNRLLTRARGRGLQIPSGLGMEEAIGTDEPAETRIWQLAAIVRMVEAAVEIGIPRVELIQPLQPATLPGESADGRILREFPIRMVFVGTYPHLLEFLERTRQEEQFFAVRNYSVEALSSPDLRRLRVEIVCAAGLLRAETSAAIPEEEREHIEYHEYIDPFGHYPLPGAEDAP